MNIWVKGKSGRAGARSCRVRVALECTVIGVFCAFLRLFIRLQPTGLWSSCKIKMSESNQHIALVTGGSRGIGKAIALALANSGAGVAVNYRERAEEAASVVAAIHRNGGRAVAVNLKSAFLCTQAVLPRMRARRWGRIINISSIGARIGARSSSVAYGAAKAGIEGLTRAYALRLAPEGVTVNAVAPGLIDTEMGKPLIEAGVAAHIPVGRVGTVDDIAQTVLLLVQNDFITGQTLAVNGGSLFS
jgi:3-oxoacyl-[acyl-carrier protein] reductase